MRLDDELRVLRGLSVAFPAVFLSIAAFMSSAVLTRLDPLAARADRAAQGVRLFVARRSACITSSSRSSSSRVAHRARRHRGHAGSAAASSTIYHRFFQFPVAHFHPDWPMFGVAFLRQRGRGVPRRDRRGAAGGEAAAGRGDAPGAAGGIQAVAASSASASRKLVSTGFPHGAAQPRAQAVAGRSSPRSASRSPPAFPIVPGAMRDGIDYLLDVPVGRRRSGRM